MRREQHLLNAGWQFAFGENPGAERMPPAADWYDVGLPHSFSLPDFREERFYVGFGCYRRTIDAPESWTGAWVALEFLGVFQVADVYLNGVHVGRHEGGYTPFIVDISDAVRAGGNELFVRVDNRWNPRIAPRGGDYSFAGGIYRDVSVLVADRVRTDWHGIGVSTPIITPESAQLAAAVDIANDEDQHTLVTVRAEVRDAGHTVAHLSHAVAAVRPGGSAKVLLKGSLGSPVLWDLDTPHLYELVVTVSVDGVVRDEVSTRFGVRSIEFTIDRGFFLNGRHVDLHGVNVHQNRGGWGDAGTRASIRRDVELVKNAGFNIIRGSHYPHHLAFAEECDRQGVLFWSELHFWGIGGENVEGYWFASAYPVNEADDADFEESLRTALREMIRTQRNHPSIITWSVGNEAFFSEDAVIDKAKALTTELVSLVHEWDPTRPASVGGAQRKGFDVLGDVAGYNGDGAELFHEPSVPSLVAEYHGVAGRGSGSFDVQWQYGVGPSMPGARGRSCGRVSTTRPSCPITVGTV
ncbi:glycoside hydrolase family 2 TIM barrel-domain containing protein [Sinomonas sp. JGH33]|uniref:Glycoside hydrolase family 2 TIM barrel-domain containing protein n=1 Tax=Sinomonas terricola TaxID=3110330 RepID=A0ABU5T6D9_9MICC|nr:glycoside hydrolase family 2 TIM barrel-domain containing protein [Sinomonas sp. JGH33]MEA5455233.1 glycoside hydrolase family 2 TIM barrel-domain containing protein [Sinomonas sp. JGH33]